MCFGCEREQAGNFIGSGLPVWGLEFFFSFLVSPLYSVFFLFLLRSCVHSIDHSRAAGARLCCFLRAVSATVSRLFRCLATLFLGTACSPCPPSAAHRGAVVIAAAASSRGGAVESEPRSVAKRFSPPLRGMTPGASSSWSLTVPRRRLSLACSLASPRTEQRNATPPASYVRWR
jgi:hypothetical protein